MNPHNALDPLDDVRLESWLDGELPPDEAARVSQLVQHDPRWREAADLHTHLRDALGRCTVKAPSGFAAGVLREVARQERRSLLEQLRAALGGVWKPALAFSLLVAAALVVFRPTPAPQPSASEIAAAKAEIEWTLAYLGQLGQKTASQVRQEALSGRLVAPVQNALGMTLEPSPSE